MDTCKFSKWTKWKDRNFISHIKYPGIYVCALGDGHIKPTGDFEWIPQIIYIGMTNSVGGLQARLRQFDNTINKRKTCHGGADRVLYKHQNYEKLTKSLYVSVAPFICNVKSNKPDDLLIMGKVAQFEYECFAEFVRKNNSLPEFNQKTSQKYSHWKKNQQ